MKNALHVTLGQQTAMTPQLLQSIRLLHLTAQEVELEIARALENNPLLELIDDEADVANDAVAVDEPAAADEVRAEDDTPTEDFDDFLPGAKK